MRICGRDDPAWTWNRMREWWSSAGPSLGLGASHLPSGRAERAVQGGNVAREVCGDPSFGKRRPPASKVWNVSGSTRPRIGTHAVCGPSQMRVHASGRACGAGVGDHGRVMVRFHPAEREAEPGADLRLMDSPSGSRAWRATPPGWWGRLASHCEMPGLHRPPLALATMSRTA